MNAGFPLGILMESFSQVRLLFPENSSLCQINKNKQTNTQNTKTNPNRFQDQKEKKKAKCKTFSK